MDTFAEFNQKQLNEKAKASKWAVVQKGHGVFGVGTSKDSAIKDAKDNIEGNKKILTDWSDAKDTDFVVVPCTDELYNKASKGDNENFAFEDGVLVYDK